MFPVDLRKVRPTEQLRRLRRTTLIEENGSHLFLQLGLQLLHLLARYEADLGRSRTANDCADQENRTGFKPDFHEDFLL